LSTDIQYHAFISYARKDDAVDNGNILEFARSLKKKVSAYAGQDFEVFFDRDEIEWGNPWERKLSESVLSASFLIPFITPWFFKSATCARECDLFKYSEDASKREDLIFPVLYMPVKEEWHVPQERMYLYKHIMERQYIDWTDNRLKSYDDPDLKQEIDKLAKYLADALMQRSKDDDEKRPQADRSEIYMKYKSLTDTQQIIIAMFYRSVHLQGVSVDDLFNSLKRETEDRLKVESQAELYYRLKDLESEGLVKIRPVGPRTTLVEAIPKVRTVIAGELST